MTESQVFFAFDGGARAAMKHVNPDRLIGMQRALARFGGRHDGGVSREALTSVELEARRWLSESFTGPQYTWLIDDAANLFLRRAGSEEDLAPVMTGSHIDTQPVGGWLDGAYGIVAGLEVMRALDDAGLSTRRPIEVAIWTNEEGSRFRPGAMGSSAFADPSRLAAFLEVCDDAGVSFGSARDAACNAAAGVKRIPLGRPVHAYLEAHIEQGPILEAGGHTLGIVTGIQGVRWLEVTVQGRSAHAGTTPLDVRQDALMTAARVVADIGNLADNRKDPALRVTIGRFEASPGSINTIAEQVIFTIDLRHPSDAVLEEIEIAIRSILASSAGPCRYDIRLLMRRSPTVFDPQVLAALESAVSASQMPACRILSGAFHDAMYLADICPTAMLFVPSRSGISHNPAEDTAEPDLVAGARALAGALTALAGT